MNWKKRYEAEVYEIVNGVAVKKGGFYVFNQRMKDSIETQGGYVIRVNRIKMEPNSDGWQDFHINNNLDKEGQSFDWAYGRKHLIREATPEEAKKLKRVLNV